MTVTIEDVARLANVSTATVSRALRGLRHVAPATRQRVERAAELLDYVVDPQARSLAMGRTNTIGAIVPTIGRWSHARMLEVVTDVAADADVDVMPLVTTTAAARRLAVPNHPFRRRVDGLVLIEADLDDAVVATLAEGRPAIAIDALTSQAVSSVRSDHATGMRSAVAHLAELGHVRIALFEATHGWATEVRRAAWMQALAAAGLEPANDLLVASQPTATGGAAALLLALDLPEPPTAVIAASDEMALGVLQVARQRGLRVPDDLSVVGTDDHPVAQYIELTTIRRGVADLARRAAAWLVDATARPPDDPTDPIEAVVDSWLAIRATTGPA